MERNPSPPTLTEDEEKVLSTDCIGDTVFSKRWVLRVLLDLMTWKEKLQESIADSTNASEDLFTVKELDSELEEELCELWDMTTNQDVCEFLDGQDGVDLLFETTLFSNYPRLTEICIGVLGNMVCLPHIAKEITHTEKYRTILLSEINNDDPQTLIELTRLIKTCIAVDEQRNVWFHSMKELKTMNQLAFIMESSLNVDLIYNVADLVDFVLDKSDEMLECTSFARMLHCVCEGLKQVRNNKPHCVDVLVHIIQILTTSKDGLQAFSESDPTHALLCKILAKTELNLVTAIARLPMLASSFSALSALFPMFKDKFAKLVCSETAIITKMVLTLEVLQKLYASPCGKDSLDAVNGCKTEENADYERREKEDDLAYDQYTSATLNLFDCVVGSMEHILKEEVNPNDVLEAFRSMKSQVHIVFKFWGLQEIFKNEVVSLKEKIIKCKELNDILHIKDES